MKPSRTWHILLALLFLLLALPAGADDAERTESAPCPPEAVGYVSAVKGTVLAINREGSSRKLETKDSIFAEDTIKTSQRGRIQIIFPDNTIVSLGRRTEVKISEYSWSADDRKGRMKTEAREGVFRIMGGAITKHAPREFTTVTPQATIGIRGSMYAGRISPAGLAVLFQGGKGIDVTNQGGAVALTVPGQATTVASAATAPSHPYLMPAAEISELLQDLEDWGGDDGGGSQIGPQSTIINKSTIRGSTNIAVGKDNAAHLGGVSVSNSKVNGTVVNKADITNTTNAAIGSDNKARTGSIVIE